tara:strand:+ start:514 stop:1107 length:594 start_codon:yes stop_codon:yes gene_type:complete
MLLDSLLAGTVLFSSFAMRSPNVQPNPDDYELSIGLKNEYFYVNRQWERELGKKYVDELIWFKFDNTVYFKPEYMNKESQGVRYLKIDWRKKLKDYSFGFTSRNDSEDVFSRNFETFISVGVVKKKKYRDDKIEVEATFDGYFPPDESGQNTTFEFEDKFKVSWKLTDKIKLYNLGEISKIQGKDYYKAKIGIEVSL